jgi:hypothetical protein
MIPYAEQLVAFVNADPALGAQISALPNLNAILKWVPTAGISLSAIDLIQQDEYCHDVTIPLPDGRWLVFGVT